MSVLLLLGLNPSLQTPFIAPIFAVKDFFIFCDRKSVSRHTVTSSLGCGKQIEPKELNTGTKHSTVNTPQYTLLSKADKINGSS